MVTKGKAIFVIDDSMTTRESARDALEAVGYRVSVFSSPLVMGPEFLKQDPELILLDVNMPALSGDKATKFIRNLRADRSPIILLYSSLPAAELRRLVQESGADDFIEKSGNPRAMLRKVRSALDAKR